MTPKDTPKKKISSVQKEDLFTTFSDTDVPPSAEVFSVEEILAEYSGSQDQQLLRETAELIQDAPDPEPPPVPRKAPSAEKSRPEPSQKADAGPPASAPAKPSPPEDPPPAAEPAPASAGTPAAPVREAPEEPPAEPAPPVREALSGPAVDVENVELPCGRPVPLEDVVGSTVDAVLEEEREPLLPPRRGLFSRRPLPDTEELPAPPEPEPEYDPEPIGPEPDLWEATLRHKRDFRRRRAALPAAAAIGLLPSLLLAAERYGVQVPRWSGDPGFQCILLLGCLAAEALLCRQVFVKGFGMVLRGRCVSELLVSLSVLAAAADCVCRLHLPERTAVMPYASVTCLALVFAQWGVSRESRGNYDMFRAAAVDAEPPYLVTDTERGACKQRGSVPGFYTAAARSDVAALWQTVLLPLFLAASLVFAGLSSFGQGREDDFFLNLTAILTAAATFSLPLCWSLPWSRLARHLQKTGCSVAGWSGAAKISREKAMIVTDTDLFPPGTLQLNGSKFFGETAAKAYSYAAAMAAAAGCGLERMFENLRREEDGDRETAEDFSFYEEGGYSASIRGETVLMGTSAFLRKMEVLLPGDINLKTGIFLAVDHHLAAVFAVKYNPAENVDFALQMMRRSRILPILASRDPNITPALLKRKFSKNLRLEYPDLSERVALSEAEKDRDLPRALLFREGLLPYAETVAGSLRLCKAVRRAAALSLLGSWMGTLLAFYLTSLGQYALLNPLALSFFLLLWTLPVFLMADWTGRY